MKLRLIKGLSFRYKDICATSDKPEIECSKTDGDYLISTGHFDICDDESDEESFNSVKKPLEKMTKPELMSYASSINIDVSDKMKKEEIIKLILEGFKPLSDDESEEAIAKPEE